MSDLDCRRAQVEDMKRIKEIVRLSFESEAKRPEVIDDLENETWFSVEHWVVAESDGTVVSALGLRPGVMWVVGVPVPATTVGTVCTQPELRGQGIGSRLMDFAAGVMREQKAVLSRLHTSAARFAFYGRLGYVKAINTWPTATLVTDAIGPRTREKAEAALGDAVIRPAHGRDAVRMLEIYEATFSRATGCISRNEHFFGRRIARKPKLWFGYAPRFDVAEDPDDGVVGYVAYSLAGGQRDIVELAVLPHHAAIARSLLLHVAREAQELDITRVYTRIDSHHPLGWLAHEFPIEAAVDSEVLFLKVHDDKRFVELIRPVIERRAEHFEVQLTMNVAGMGKMTFGKGQELGIVTDVPHLAALLYNGVWLSGLMGQGALSLEPETIAAHRALQSLFPDTHARRCRLDGY